MFCWHTALLHFTMTKSSPKKILTINDPKLLEIIKMKKNTEQTLHFVKNVDENTPTPLKTTNDETPQMKDEVE